MWKSGDGVGDGYKPLSTLSISRLFKQIIIEYKLDFNARGEIYSIRVL